MNTRYLTVVGVGLALAAMILSGSVIKSQEPPPATNDDAAQAAAAQEGVEVMARGPVHEAFAEPVIRGPRPAPVVNKKPPDPIEELPPDQKPDGQNVQWIPGYWGWDEDRNDYIWISGTWRAEPPGREWFPGHWNQVDDGWQWVSGYWADQQQKDVEFLPEPPDPIVESAPQAPAPDQVFVPGSWVWQDTRYLWRPGFWMPHRVGWIWIPAHYVWTPGGYVFVGGYWDYPLLNRGLLFAPVYVDSGYWSRPRWFYRPAFAIYADFLLGSLFVRAECNHYYFGDYFAPAYASRGFVSWVDFRIGQRYYDPLYSYCAWQHRSNPRWATDLRQLYIGRRDGRIAPPPRTLVQQNTFVQNNQITTINKITNINNVTINNIANVTPVVPLRQVSNTGIKMQAVSASAMAQDRAQVAQFRELGKRRAQTENQIVARGSPISETGAGRGPVKATISGARPTHAAVTTVKPPPAPTVPKPQIHVPSGPAPGTNVDRGRRDNTVPRAGQDERNRGTGRPPANVEQRQPAGPPNVERKASPPPPPPKENKPPPNLERKASPPPPPPKENRPPPNVERKASPPPPPPKENRPPPNVERRVAPPPPTHNPEPKGNPPDKRKEPEKPGNKPPSY
jgi:hypothetical protein